MVADSSDWKLCGELLADGVADLDVAVSQRAQRDMLRYLQELQTWNGSYNLTAVREPVQMVVKHLLDSLAVLPHLGEGRRLVDVGTGAGLPGLVLAMALPKLEVSLLDSNGKKAAFLRHCMRSLELRNVQVIQSRVEDYKPAKAFDTVISRAFAAANAFVAAAGHLCADEGQILAMLGTEPDAQHLEGLGVFALRSMQPLQVPGLAAERHIAVLKRGLI